MDSQVPNSASARVLNSQPTMTPAFVNMFSSRYGILEAPKFKLQDKPVPAEVAFQSINDLRQLDNNPRLNLASFCTTWMEPEAKELIVESLNVNLVDIDQYPASNDIHNRCVKIISDLYHAPDPNNPFAGTSTTGSSEAIMLAGLALRKRWKNRRIAAGLPADNPNLVMGHNTQVVWEKFCRYFEVEPRMAPLSEGCYVLTPSTARPLVDENTIGIVGILGSTYTGEYEDIQGLSDLCDELREEKGYEVGVHVDAASGGFVAPFLTPELEWDFRVKNVRSINVSGHKYGLVYPGLGWVLWREQEDLPEDLVFHTNYLGSDQPSITLTFSRSASPIMAQYYQLMRLGRDGYTQIMCNLQCLAQFLTNALRETGDFVILSKDVGVPTVAFSLVPTRKVITPSEKGDSDSEGTEKRVPRMWDEFDMADKLRERGWVLPAYRMAPDAKHIKLVRAVIREDMTMTLITELLKGILHAVEFLDHHDVTLKNQQTATQAVAAWKGLVNKFQPHRREDNPLRADKHHIGC